MRCWEFSYNISAFLDGELDPQKQKQMERHLSECEDCRREAEKMGEMISIIKDSQSPYIPANLWEGTRRKIMEAERQKPVFRWFRMPKWSFIPAAAMILLLLYFTGNQMFVRDPITEPKLMTVYLQEYVSSHSEQVLPSSPLSELTIAQTGQVTEDSQTNESISELDMLMEVHYGIYSTNES
jgi:predicted anti-sigma-YlaC factor YlaD